MRLYTEVLEPDVSTFAWLVISLSGVMCPLWETARNIGFVGSLESRSERPEPEQPLIQSSIHQQFIACRHPSSQFRQ